MILINILLIVLILAAISLCVFLILYLKKIVFSVEKMQSDIHELTKETVPILRNLTDATDKVNRITEDAEKHWNDLENTIQNVRDRFSRLTHNSITDSAENTGKDVVRNISAIVKGLTVFWSKWRQ